VALERESLVLRYEFGDPVGVSLSLDGLASVAGAQGRLARAARLFGMAEAIRARIDAIPFPHLQIVYDRAVAAVRAGLGEQAFAEAWAQGRATPADQAVAYALAEPEPPSPAVDPQPQPLTSRPPARLTGRERDVAALVARGLTNRQIAEQLVIAERTAETHVGHILNKLGFTSRAQIASWAAEQRLSPEQPD
jgi:DNA-binding NarL/FixJ family response regulator